MLNSESTQALPIVTLFDSSDAQSLTTKYYREVMIQSLKKMLPHEFLDFDTNDKSAIDKRKNLFRHSLPIISKGEIETFPGNVSFFALSSYRSNSFKFFFEMISRWLTPGQRLNVVLIYASDFRLCDQTDEIYTVCEIIIHVETKEEFEEIKRNYPMIQTQIELGIDSAFYAQRILDVKGLSADEKTATIQENIAYLVKRFPTFFDYDIFTEMQHMLLISSDDFKYHRSSRHLSRIISVHYQFRRSILKSLKAKAQKRHLYLKVFRALVDSPKGSKKVLGILVGMNFLAERESIGEKQLLKAIQQYIKTAESVPNSFFINKNDTDHIVSLYLEVEKSDGSDFTAIDINKLRRELPLDLQNRIVHRHHPIFMPRNEEEIMRNIIILCDQLKFIKDIPQILITFDHQTHSHIYFTVVVARILKSDSLPISKLIEQSNIQIGYLHDRVKEMGMIRKKYVKEATVFRARLNKEKFLRDDQSIDLYKARQTLVCELGSAIGDIRDYNGGMISKQHEVLANIRKLLSSYEPYDALLMEDLFYSFMPDVVRALLDPQSFVDLFDMASKAIREYDQKGCLFRYNKDSYNVLAIVLCNDDHVSKKLIEKIDKPSFSAAEISSSRIKVNGHYCIGFLNCIREPHQRELFIECIQEVLQEAYPELMQHCIG